MTSRRISSGGRPARRRNPRGEGGRLREDLLEAAGELIAETGTVDAASVRAVARRAGVSAPSVYLHFADRDELVQAVLEQRFTDLHDAVAGPLGSLGPEATSTDYLFTGCAAYVAYGLDHPGHYRVLFDSPAEPFSPETTAAADAALGLLIDGVAASAEAGADIPGTPVEAATLVWCALHGMVMLRIASPGYAWPPVDQALTIMLQRLLGLPGGD